MTTNGQCNKTVRFPCGSAGKESARSVADLGLMPTLGRSPGEGKGFADLLESVSIFELNHNTLGFLQSLHWGQENGIVTQMSQF